MRNAIRVTLCNSTSSKQPAAININTNNNNTNNNKNNNKSDLLKRQVRSSFLNNIGPRERFESSGSTTYVCVCVCISYSLPPKFFFRWLYVRVFLSQATVCVCVRRMNDVAPTKI